ncbi:carboxypeptidase regulatory-like domain-containing protein [Thermofilum pendens]|uniref:Carboxypeptidase regulatory-like domain-containing protein n=1 Tax=Thermofilum pendens (strain DSM 2475 / Hrk 5) TaxID=368408 RepID=A1RZN8_THEPD|nr:carboxypeptidase regulatory-like domain-containing protein [Thermofilum pendens]ABL78668.1 hypothetical protein Tpen_1270 [Thermofilum pendens Hrk 5]
MLRRRVYALVLLALAVAYAATRNASAQVPVTVWGYVKMPDGSPAAGASVTVSAGGASASTVTDSTGKYKVDLTVSSTPVTVTVTASLGGYAGSASASGEGVVRVDVVLQPPPPPPKKPTSVYVSVDRPEYGVGDAALVQGRLSPAMQAAVKVVVVAPNGSRYEVSVSTGSDGSFTVRIPLTSRGAWSIYAAFPGSDEYSPSTSQVVTVVAKEKTFLSVSARSPAPGIVQVSGSLAPAPSGAVVEVYVSIDNGSTWARLLNAPVGGDGSFSANLSTAVYGRILVKAVFRGTFDYAQSETAPVAVEVSSPRELLLTQENERLKAREKALNETLERLSAEVGELRRLSDELKSSLSSCNATVEARERALENLERELALLRGELEKTRLLAYAAVPAAAALGALAGFALGRRKRGKREAPSA